MEKKRILICALTGGPCAGKTTALPLLIKALKEHPVYSKYNIFSVPESATLHLNCGPQYPGLTEDKRGELIHYEEVLMKLQLALEDSVFDIAKFHSSSQSTIVICDRGTIDIKPYVQRDIWDIILRDLNLEEETLRSRYGAVVHLVSAAVGAESFYSNASNEVRTETAEEARELDERTFSSWKGHPNLFRIDNNFDSFELKLEKVVNTVIEFANSYFNNPN